jgi:multidrug efflux system membrane fusion protein
MYSLSTPDRIFCSFALCILLIAGGCSGQKTEAAGQSGAGRNRGAGGRAGGRGDAPVPVLVAKAVQKNVPVEAEVIGTVEAFSTVTIKPQISGQLIQAHFQEGQFVNKGQLLVTIDPRALEAQVKQTEATIARDQAAITQAQANVARDRAQEANARAQLDRASQLWKSGIISKEQHDQAATTVETLQATINASVAAVENAQAQIAASRASLENQKVQLGFTRIYSPISGRTGTLLVKPGNVVQANTSELTTINQVQPVYVTFALPEAYLPEIRRNTRGLTVVAKSDEGGIQESGKVAYFENTVDVTTGTIKLKATFPNANRTLWPGQFVRVTVRLQDRPNAIVVPNQAIQTGQDGTYVYIVKPDQTVEIRPVTPGQRSGEETVVDKGVQPGETVVTEGTLRLVPGARVQLRERGVPGGSGGQRRTGRRS